MIAAFAHFSASLFSSSFAANIPSWPTSPDAETIKRKSDFVTLSSLPPLSPFANGLFLFSSSNPSFYFLSLCSSSPPFLISLLLYSSSYPSVFLLSSSFHFLYYFLLPPSLYHLVPLTFLYFKLFLSFFPFIFCFFYIHLLPSRLLFLFFLFLLLALTLFLYTLSSLRSLLSCTNASSGAIPPSQPV
jgi:hypothetical protein